MPTTDFSQSNQFLSSSQPLPLVADPYAGTAVSEPEPEPLRLSIQPAAEETDPMPRLERYTMQSAILPDAREVAVYLPTAYAREPERRFPVFYLHDGQNLFDGRKSYMAGHTWRAGETADRETASGTIEPMILVGIANAGLRRLDEYTPTRDASMGGGQGSRYGRMLIEELKPFIDRHYRTQPHPSETAVGGSSLGGLISLYLGFTRPDVFGRLAVLSPSIWWNQRSILPVVAEATPKPELKIWLDIGTAEGSRHVRDTDKLHRLLLERGWRDEVDLRYRHYPNAVHNEDAWADRFGEVLQFLFARL